MLRTLKLGYGRARQGCQSFCCGTITTVFNDNLRHGLFNDWSVRCRDDRDEHALFELFHQRPDS